MFSLKVHGNLKIDVALILTFQYVYIVCLGNP